LDHWPDFVQKAWQYVQPEATSVNQAGSFHNSTSPTSTTIQTPSEPARDLTHQLLQYILQRGVNVQANLITENWLVAGLHLRAILHVSCFC